MSDSRNDFSRNRMDGNEADDDFIIQGAAETAVAVRAVGPECVGIGAGGPLAQHASFLAFGSPISGLSSPSSHFRSWGMSAGVLNLM